MQRSPRTVNINLAKPNYQIARAIDLNMNSKEIYGAEGSATQRAYLRLRELIITGALIPGKKLKIETLRKLLNTGASPVREALTLLTSDNLVERLDQRGFRAAEVSASNFAEILLLRCQLEDIALRQSIANATTEWEERMVLAQHRMLRAKKLSPKSVEEFHKAFHMGLLANAHAPVLLKFCSQLYDLNIRYRFLAGNALNYQSRNIDAEHSGVLEAAIAGDADLASDLLCKHYQLTGEFLSGLFDSSNNLLGQQSRQKLSR